MPGVLVSIHLARSTSLVNLNYSTLISMQDMYIVKCTFNPVYELYHCTVSVHLGGLCGYVLYLAVTVHDSISTLVLGWLQYRYRGATREFMRGGVTQILA